MYINGVCIAISSVTLVSSKRSASVAGMDASGGTSSNKRQRVQKNTMKKATETLAVQNGIYAAEKFSDSFSISHVLNLLIESMWCIRVVTIIDIHPDDCLWISWIDREGPILSSGCSFFENLPLMLVLLLVIQRFGRRQWGYISELATENRPVLLRAINADGTLGVDKVVVNFFPGDKVHSTWGLLGRATTVVGANRNKEVRVEEEPKDGGGGLSGDHYNSLDSARISLSTTANSEELGEEWRAYYQARDEYRKTYANTIKSHNLVLKVSWPETSRIEEWKIVEHARALSKNDKFIKGHIPHVEGARDFDHYSTKHIRCFLDIQQNESPGTRTLRLIVVNRLWPIYDLDGEQFWNTFWQCVACAYTSIYIPKPPLMLPLRSLPAVGEWDSPR